MHSCPADFGQCSLNQIYQHQLAGCQEARDVYHSRIKQMSESCSEIIPSHEENCMHKIRVFQGLGFRQDMDHKMARNSQLALATF
jgi:hypothetical protein